MHNLMLYDGTYLVCRGSISKAQKNRKNIPLLKRNHVLLKTDSDFESINRNISTKENKREFSGLLKPILSTPNTKPSTARNFATNEPFNRCLQCILIRRKSRKVCGVGIQCDALHLLIWEFSKFLKSNFSTPIKQACRG